MVNISSQVNNDSRFNPEKAIFSISVVADLLKVHQRTLRIYDEEKLLTPTRSAKNRRLYNFNDIEKGKAIQYLTNEIGLNLIGVKIVFHLLNQLQVKPEDFVSYINEVANSIGISREEQELNRIKRSKRGRRPIID